MSTYNELVSDFQKELKSVIKSNKLDPLPIFEENCDTCGSSLKNYYADKEGI